MLKVLVVDDQPALRLALTTLFSLHDLECLSAADADEALRLARSGEVGVVVQDMNFSRGKTSGDEGKLLFRELKALDPEMPVLLITAWTSLERAVELVKEGAADYLAKPWDDRKLVESVKRLLAARNARNQALSSPKAKMIEGMVVESPALRRIVELALHVAPAAIPILITGPNGSGKERIADLLHKRSPRHDRPFVKVNVGALPADLLEAELFGAEAGAYTGLKSQRIGRFELADQGTLFLDEVDSLSLTGQVKLLRVLESGEFQRLGSSRTLKTDVRVISATNADLKKAIVEGRFREDLFFRLNVVELAVPPLAARRDDILPLAALFLAQAQSAGSRPTSFSAGALQALLEHDWPGNVREMRNRVQRAVLVAEGSAIAPGDLDLDGPVGSHFPAEPADERQRLEAALRAAGGIVAHAAQSLGLSRQAFYRKLSKHGLELERRVRD
jgi:DNA-binding NtrC family response regulator